MRLPWECKGEICVSLKCENGGTRGGETQSRFKESPHPLKRRASARSIIHFYNMELDYFFLACYETVSILYTFVKKQINRYVTVIMLYKHIVIIFSLLFL
jgi:hypothetical protein